MNMKKIEWEERGNGFPTCDAVIIIDSGCGSYSAHPIIDDECGRIETHGMGRPDTCLIAYDADIDLWDAIDEDDRDDAVERGWDDMPA